MNRLTYRLEDQNGNKTNTVVYNVVESGESCIPKTMKEKSILQRLAEYEDTGLTPEEIYDLESMREISPEAEYFIDKHANTLIEKLSKLLEETKHGNCT